MGLYSKEFWREALAAIDKGMGTRDAGPHFGVSEPWVRPIKQERRERG